MQGGRRFRLPPKFFHRPTHGAARTRSSGSDADRPNVAPRVSKGTNKGSVGIGKLRLGSGHSRLTDADAGMNPKVVVLSLIGELWQTRLDNNTLKFNNGLRLN